MISWITGEIVESWQTNKKFFVLVNCQGIGYEIQILEEIFLKLKKSQITNKIITLWIKHIKKEESDLLFGFTSNDQKQLFIEILSIRGVGSQIAMSLLNKFSISELINAVNTQNKKLITSVPGIGQKMTERLFLELKSKFKNKLQIEEEEKNKFESFSSNNEINKTIGDLKLILLSLNYTKKEIESILPIIIKESDYLTNKAKKVSFENILKKAMNYLDNASSNIAR